MTGPMGDWGSGLGVRHHSKLVNSVFEAYFI